MGAISYFPRKNSLDTKRKLLIATEFALAIFLFLMPGGPGRPAPEDGPDPADLANFHSNGWPESNSWPFNLVLVEQVAGSSNDESDDGSNEPPIIIVEEVADDQPVEPEQVAEDEIDDVQGHRRNHHHNQGTTQDPNVGSENDDETNQESGQGDDASDAVNQTNAASGNYTTLEDQAIQIQLWNNANGSSAVISNITQPLHGTVTFDSNNTLTYTPDPNYNGIDSFVVSSTDGGGSSTQNVAIIIIATNDLPSASNLTVTTTEDTPLMLTLINGTSDVDGDVTSLVITVMPTHGIVTISPDNKTVTYTPNQDFQGIDSFGYTIADASHNSNGTVDVIVTPVNDIPIIDGAALDTISTVEGSPVQIDILSHVFDPDADILTISNFTQPLSGVVTMNVDGTVTYAPSPGFVGQDSFSFTITDSNGGTVSGSLTITVLPADVIPPGNDVENPANDTQSNDDTPIPENAAPTAGNVIVVLGEDSSASIQLDATDPDGDAIMFSIVSQPLHGTLVMIDNSSGTVQFIPLANYFGPDSFTYQVSDGIAQSDIASVELVVTGINDAPVVHDDWVYGYEGNLTIVDVLSETVDVDGDLLSIEISEAPHHGIVSVNGDGTITYAPNPDFDGTDSFEYMISDGNGGSASATVTITLGSVNDVPVTANGAVVTDEDQSVEIELHAVDVEGGILDLEILVVPLHGNLEILTGGNFVVRYIPEENYHGVDGFTFRVTDGLAYSNVGSVSIVVTSVNDVPIATSDSFALTEDMPLTGDILLNDVDVDGDSLSASLIPGGTTHGTLVVNPDGSFLYLSEKNFNGVASFQYQISDGNGGIATGTVMITVTNVNDAPVAFDDVAETTCKQPVLIQVLSNDVDSDSGILSVGSVGTASHGSVAISADGKAIIYEPNRSFSGEDHFNYTVTDGTNSDSATVHVTVHKKHHDDDDYDDEDDDDDRDGNDEHHDHDKTDNDKQDDDHDGDNHGGVGNHDDDSDEDDNEEKEQNHDDEERDDDHDDKEKDHEHSNHDDDNDDDCGENDHDEEEDDHDDD
jgi:hypothetical protein